RHEERPISEAIDAVPSRHNRKILRNIIYNDEFTNVGIDVNIGYLHGMGIEVGLNRLFLLALHFTTELRNRVHLLEDMGIDHSEKGFASLLGIPENILNGRLAFIKRHELEVNTDNLSKTIEKLHYAIPEEQRLRHQKADYLASKGLMSPTEPIDDAVRAARPKRLRKFIRKIINNDDLSLQELIERGAFLWDKEVPVNYRTVFLLNVDHTLLSYNHNFLVGIAGIRPHERGYISLLGYPFGALRRKHTFLTKYGLPVTVENFKKSVDKLVLLLSQREQKRFYFASLGLMGKDILKSIPELISEVPRRVRKFLRMAIYDDGITLEKIKERVKFLRDRGIEITQRTATRFLSPLLSIEDIQARIIFLENEGIRINLQTFPLLLISLQNLYKKRNFIVKSGLEVTADRLMSMGYYRRTRMENLARLRLRKFSAKEAEFQQRITEYEDRVRMLEEAIESRERERAELKRQAESYRQSVEAGNTVHEQDLNAILARLNTAEALLKAEKKDLAEAKKVRDKFMDEQWITSRLDRETRQPKSVRRGFLSSFIPEHRELTGGMKRTAADTYRLMRKPEYMIMEEAPQTAEPAEIRPSQGAPVKLPIGIFGRAVSMLEGLKRHIAGETPQISAETERERERVRKIVEDDERFHVDVVHEFEAWYELEEMDGKPPTITEEADELIAIICRTLARYMSEQYGLKAIEWLIAEPIPLLEHMVFNVLQRKGKILSRTQKAAVRAQIDTRLWDLFTSRKSEFTEAVAALFGPDGDPFMRDFIIQTVLKDKRTEGITLPPLRQAGENFTRLSRLLQGAIADNLTAYFEAYYLEAKKKQIDEIEKEYPGIEGGGIEAREGKVEKLKEKIRQAQTALARATAGARTGRVEQLKGQIADYEDEITELEMEIKRLLRAIDAKISPRALEHAIGETLGHLTVVMDSLQNARLESNDELARELEGETARLESRLAELEEEREKIERAKAEIRRRFVAAERKTAETDARIEEAKENLIGMVQKYFEPEFYRVREAQERDDWEDA
ncbi:MAG: hypothetical protein ACE5JK_06670, partial [Candidatus Omnitrophota bacterium]